MLYRNIFCLVFAAMIAGCSSSDSDDAGMLDDPAGAGTGDEVAPGAGTGDEVVPAEQAAALEGSWETPCAESSISKRVFAGDVVAGSNGNFGDAECVILRELVALQGTFVLGGSVITAGGLQATEIDITDDTTGSTSMSIFLIQDDVLYLGDTDAVAEGVRPDALNFNRGFIRQ